VDAVGTDRDPVAALAQFASHGQEREKVALGPDRRHHDMPSTHAALLGCGSIVAARMSTQCIAAD
jgi:hypothetical protein